MIHFFVAAAHNTTRRQQQQCTQPDNDGVPEETCAKQNHSPKLASFTSQNAPPVIPSFVALLLLVTTSIAPAMCLPLQGNHTFRPPHQLLKLRRVRAHLKRINKPPVKTIQASSFCDPQLDSDTVIFFHFISMVW